MVTIIAQSPIDCELSQGLVEPETIELVFATSPLSTQCCLVLIGHRHLVELVIAMI